MKRFIFGFVVLFVVLALVGVGQVNGEITFTYTGTLGRDGSDNVGLQDANFTCIGVFPDSPYVDDGSGQPILYALSTKFTISNAPVESSNGEYYLDAETPLVIYPNLDGAFSNAKFIHEVTGWTTGPRLIANLQNLNGGNGSNVNIGQMPLVSHFPTSISEPTMLALPANMFYNVYDPAIETVPEPATITLLLCGLASLALLRRR